MEMARERWLRTDLESDLRLLVTNSAGRQWSESSVMNSKAWGGQAPVESRTNGQKQNPAALASSLYLEFLGVSRLLEARKGVVVAETELCTTLREEG